MKRLLSLGLTLFALARLAVAQSANDWNEGARLTLDGSTGGYTFSWWGRTGYTYFLQHSEDLFDWHYIGILESGFSLPIEYHFTSSDERFFLRLQISDIPTTNPFQADFDGDGVSNEAELAQDTDPLAARDADENSLFDDWEILHFGQTGADPQGDADGDSLTNLQEAFAGGDPNNGDTNSNGIGDAAEFVSGTLASPADSDGDGVPDISDAFPFDSQLALPWVSYALIEMPATPGGLPSFGMSVNQQWQSLARVDEILSDDTWSHHWTRGDWFTQESMSLVTDQFGWMLGLGDDGSAYGNLIEGAERWLPNGAIERFRCLHESIPRYIAGESEEYNNTTNWHRANGELTAFSKGGGAVGMTDWRNWRFETSSPAHYPPYRQGYVGVRFLGPTTLPTELPHILCGQLPR